MRSLPSLRCRLALVLAFALVAAQALGLMHRIVHGPLAHPVHASLAPGAQAHLHDVTTITRTPMATTRTAAAGWPRCSPAMATIPPAACPTR